MEERGGLWDLCVSTSSLRLVRAEVLWKGIGCHMLEGLLIRQFRASSSIQLLP